VAPAPPKFQKWPLLLAPCLQPPDAEDPRLGAARSGVAPVLLGGTAGLCRSGCAQSPAPPGAVPARAGVRLARNTAALVI
jgi:hypothetical protein